MYVDRRAARTAVAWRFAGTWWDSTVRFVVLAHPVVGCLVGQSTCAWEVSCTGGKWRTTVAATAHFKNYLNNLHFPCYLDPLESSKCCALACSIRRSTCTNIKNKKQNKILDIEAQVALGTRVIDQTQVALDTRVIDKTTACKRNCKTHPGSPGNGPPWPVKKKKSVTESMGVQTKAGRVSVVEVEGFLNKQNRLRLTTRED